MLTLTYHLATHLDLLLRDISRSLVVVPAKDHDENVVQQRVYPCFFLTIFTP